MKIGNIIWGLVLIIIGVVFGLNAFGANIDIFFDGWWTLFIIVPCLVDIFKGEDRTGSLIGLLIGIALLLGCQDFIGFDIIWKLIVPIILVVIGLSLIFKNAFKENFNKEIKRLNENKSGKEYNGVFSSQKVNFDGEKFDGCDLNAVFGGVVFDLTNATLGKEQVINASAIFGGIDIIVPKNAVVKVNSNSVFGGVTNRVKNRDDKKAPVIYINASSIFGGVEIK